MELLCLYVRKPIFRYYLHRLHNASSRHYYRSYCASFRCRLVVLCVYVHQRAGQRDMSNVRNSS